MTTPHHTKSADTPNVRSKKKGTRRKSRETLFGLQIAPTPLKRRPGQAPRRTFNGVPVKRSRGIAMLMVMTLLVLATTITLELQYDSRVQLQLAANSRNALQAEYLARSSVQFTHLMLAFNSQFIRLKSQFKKYLAMLPTEAQMILNRLQIWKVAPINSDLLKQLVGGAFGRAKVEEKDKNKQGQQGKLYAFGDFKGRFSAQLTDESAKINLNRFYNYSDARALRTQLAALFAPERYNKLFENERATGIRLNRIEQIAAIQDWVDRNNTVFGGSDSEDSKYKYQERKYFAKNSYLYSVDEMRLIAGIDDRFFDLFGQYFTVYGPTQRINLNEAREEVLRALVMTYARIKPQERAIFLTPQFRLYMQEMLRYRSFMGFGSRKEWVRWCANPVVLDPRMFQGGAGGVTGGPAGGVQGLPKFAIDTRRIDRDSLNLMTNADTFRVVAVGHVGTVKRRITTVIHVQPRGKRDVYYWRMH